MLLLTASLTEGRGPPQRLPGLGPPIRMGIMRIVYVKVITQPRGKVIDRAKSSALEKTTRQHSKPQCHLIEPRPVLRGTMHHRLMGRIAQARPPLRSPSQRLGKKGESTPCGHEAAHLQAPVGREIRDDPGIAWPGGALPDDVGQRGGDGLTGACWAEMPPPLAGRHHPGGHQPPPPRAAVLVLTLLRFPRLGWLRGICALEHLPPRLCVATEDQASLRGEAQGVAIKRTEVPRLGRNRRGMTLAPGHAPMRFESGGGAGPPEG